MSRHEIEKEIALLQEEIMTTEGDIVALTDRIGEVQWQLEMGGEGDYEAMAHERQRAIDKRRHCRREKIAMQVKLHRLIARAQELFGTEATR